MLLLDNTIEEKRVISFLDELETPVIATLKNVSGVTLVSASEVQDVLLDMLNSISSFRESLKVYDTNSN